MITSAHFFNIESPDQLFSLLKVVAKRFTNYPSKRTEDLLLLVFGLTHLREWIAPDYCWKTPAVAPGEKFYHAIFKLEEFKLLQGLCNRSKHMGATKTAMGALHGGPIDNCPDIDSVLDFDRGVPIAYFVDGRDMDDVIRAVIKFYEEQWFRNTSQP
jgi:hypothetical protein